MIVGLKSTKSKSSEWATNFDIKSTNDADERKATSKARDKNVKEKNINFKILRASMQWL